MSQQYVLHEEGTYRVAGTRVTLDSVVYAYQRGASPESIQRSFPVLTLEQVHGALAFYLANRPEIDNYLADGASKFAELEKDSREHQAEWYEKIRRARQETLTSHS